MNAAQALGRSKDVRAVPALLVALKHWEYEVRTAAEAALAEIGTRAIPAMAKAYRNEPSCQPEICGALKRMGEPAVPALLATLKHDSANFHSPNEKPSGSPFVVEALLELIHIPDLQKKQNRCWAAEVLGRIGAVTAVPVLIRTLKDSDPEIRSLVAEALGRIGDASALPALAKALQDPDTEVSQAATKALGRFKDVRAVPALLVALESEAYEIHWAVKEALAEIGEPAVPAMIEALQHERAEVRSAAAEELRRREEVRAIPALIHALQDSSPQVRASSIDALRQLQDESTVPILIQTLRDSNTEVRCSAIYALSCFGDVRAVPGLIAILENREQEANIQRAAAWALGGIGDVAALSPLIQALQHPDESVRSAAASALGNLGDAAAIRALIQALKDTHADTRTQAEEALDKFTGDSQGLPLKVIAHDRMTPGERLDTLEALCTVRFRNIRALLTSVVDISHYCRELMARSGQYPAVKAGAEAVLKEIGKRADREMALRASQAPRPTTPRDEYLRPAEGSPAEERPDQLLRGSDAPNE